jgi:tetratricopeptide (TPR) repeat protein
MFHTHQRDIFADRPLETFVPMLHLPAIRDFALVVSAGEIAGLNSEERCGLAGERMKISLFGSFRAEGPGGENLTPKGRKAQALLAMLALAERGERSRVWLCDKLWSDRQAEQAFASLRQCLMDIRRSFGAICSEVLDISQFTIRLELPAVEVDALAMREAWSRGDTGNPILARRGEFLEGIDVGDSEFEDWLAVERSRWQDFREEIEASKAKSRPAVPISTPSASPSIITRDTRLFRPGIRILPPVASNDNRRSYELADELTELFIKSVIDIESIDVVDAREYDNPVLSLAAASSAQSTPLVFQARARSSGTDQLAEIKIANTLTARIEFIKTLPVDSSTPISRNPHILSQVNFATDAIQNIYRRTMVLPLDSPEATARLLVLSAIDDMYDLSRERHEQAEARIKKSIELAPSAQAYAWLAYLQTFKVGQCFAPRSPAITEEAERAFRKAMELDPNNSLSLTLCAHVNLFVLNNRDRAEDLVQRSLAINPNRPMSWDIYSVMYAYNGQPDIGIKYANWASSISEYGPYAFFLDTGKCMNYTLAGEFENAVTHGYKALKARPNFLPALRYTAISLGNLGRIEEAGKLARDMRRIDRNISAEAIVGSAFFNLSDEQKAILRIGLKRSGID